jgi:hypothetical protein
VEESVAPEDSRQESSAAQVSLGAQLSATPQHSSRHSSQRNHVQERVPVNPVSGHKDEESSAPQFSLPAQDSSANRLILQGCPAHRRIFTSSSFLGS